MPSDLPGGRIGPASSEIEAVSGPTAILQALPEASCDGEQPSVSPSLPAEPRTSMSRAAARGSVDYHPEEHRDVLTDMPNLASRPHPTDRPVNKAGPLLQRLPLSRTSAPGPAVGLKPGVGLRRQSAGSVQLGSASAPDLQRSLQRHSAQAGSSERAGAPLARASAGSLQRKSAKVVRAVVDHVATLDDHGIVVVPPLPKVSRVSADNRAGNDLTSEPQATSGDDDAVPAVKVDAGSSEMPWQPYELAEQENQVLPFLPTTFYKWRWWLQNRNPLRTLVWRGTISIGDVLLFAIIWGLVLAHILATRSVLWSGTISSISLLFTYFFAMHNNTILLLFCGLPFERALFWHVIVAAATVVHGIFHMTLVYAVGVPEPEDGIDPSHHIFSEPYVNGMIISGWIMLAGMLGMVATALPPVRRRFFASFYRVHVFLAFVVVVGAFLHGSGSAAWDGRVPVGVLGGLLWLTDVLVRTAYMASFRHAHHVDISVVSESQTAGPGYPEGPTSGRQPHEVVKLRWRRGTMTYAAGQWLFICIPRLGLLHWHPFTISSAPHEDNVTVHFASVGPWTRKAARLAETCKGPVRALIEGPYGAPMLDIHGPRYKCFLLVGGGMGVTALRSWKGHLINDVQRGRHLKVLRVVWSLRQQHVHLVDDLGGWEDKACMAHMPDDLVAVEDIYLTGGKRKAPPAGESQAATGKKPLPPSAAALALSRLSAAGGWRLGRDSAASGGSSAFAPELARSSATSYVQTMCDLHRASVPSETGDSAMHPMTRVHTGRPDLPAVFAHAREEARARGERRVAVLVCGPEVMVRMCQQLCHPKRPGSGTSFDNHDVQFDCHWETFDF